MKKFFILCMGVMMLMANASVEAKEKSKTTNLMIGVTPGLGRYTTSIKFGSKDNAKKDYFTYNKEIGVVVGYERVINGFIVMPELRWYRGTWQESEDDTYRSGFPYYGARGNMSDVNEFGFMEWAGFTINSGKRFQVPIMGGIGLSYVTGAPYHNLFFDYGGKVRMKFYFTPKFGIFVGGFYEGGLGSSGRGMSSDDKDKFTLLKTNLGGEVGVTITL